MNEVHLKCPGVLTMNAKTRAMRTHVLFLQTNLLVWLGKGCVQKMAREKWRSVRASRKPWRGLVIIRTAARSPGGVREEDRGCDKERQCP